MFKYNPEMRLTKEMCVVKIEDLSYSYIRVTKFRISRYRTLQIFEFYGLRKLEAGELKPLLLFKEHWHFQYVLKWNNTSLVFIISLLPFS